MTSALAEVPAECTSKLGVFDLCKMAREAQKSLAPNLPSRLNKDTDIDTVLAVGPSINLSYTYHITKRKYKRAIASGAIAQKALQKKIITHGTNAVCSQATMAAFVKLGGRIQFQFKTTDGYIFVTGLVDKCE